MESCVNFIKIAGRKGVRVLLEMGAHAWLETIEDVRTSTEAREINLAVRRSRGSGTDIARRQIREVGIGTRKFEDNCFRAIGFYDVNGTQIGLAG